MRPISNDDLAACQDHFLIDYQEAGAPLIVSFGYYDVNNRPQFNFYGRLKKLEQQAGRKLNKLLLRDPSQLWYLRGIEGLGADVAATTQQLRQIIDEIAPSAVVTLGQSMGAYAALLYGALLGAEKAIAFGPLSCFDRRLWSLIGDRRWEVQLAQLEATGANVAPYHDLPPLLQAHPGLQVDLIYGTAPEHRFDRSHSVNYDAAHAMRFYGLPGIQLLPLHDSPHAVVEHFRRQGVITDVLAQRLFGTSLDGTITRQAADDWVRWLEENLALGCNMPQLEATMRGQLDETSTYAIIDRCFLRRGLGMLAANPPSMVI